MCKFPVGTRVVVSVPGLPSFDATVTRVVFPDGAIGGLFNVAADDGRKFHSDADVFAGDWLTPVADGAVFAHRDALVAIGGGA